MNRAMKARTPALPLAVTSHLAEENMLAVLM
jgi:hypothetical protein